MVLIKKATLTIYGATAFTIFKMDRNDQFFCPRYLETKTPQQRFQINLEQFRIRSMFHFRFIFLVFISLLGNDSR